MTPESAFPTGDISIGTDIIEIARFRSLDSDAPFLQRTFSEAELKYCTGYSEPASHLAATFAGKEAVIKAVSNRLDITFSDIEILRNERGAPIVHLRNAASLCVVVSLSHSDKYAVAMALAYPCTERMNEDELRKLLNGTISQIQPE